MPLSLGEVTIEVIVANSLRVERHEDYLTAQNLVGFSETVPDLGFTGGRRSDDEHGVTNVEKLLHLDDLVKEAGLWLQLHLHSSYFTGIHEIFVHNTLDVGSSREQVGTELSEDRLILLHELRQVEVTQRAHEDNVLLRPWRSSTFEATGYAQDSLGRTQTPVIEPLLRKELLGEVVQSCEFVCEHTGASETFRHEHILANQPSIGHNHRTWTEERLKVLRQLSTPSVTGVHRDEHTDGGDQLQGVSHQIKRFCIGLKSVKHARHLRCDDGKDLDTDTVELVEATPSSDLRKAFVDCRHRLDVHLLRAVENVHGDSHTTSKILNGLGFSCSSRSCRSTSHLES
mmetsp:Transcript_39857/g.66769  ORF Transcript_39857/g.66769 Transcript_39857/m.66769 type:complete len:343 (-) Transcript_39857:805-1833(-)